MSQTAQQFMQAFDSEDNGGSEVCKSAIIEMENLLLEGDLEKIYRPFLRVLQTCTKKKTARLVLEIYLREQNTF